jgi:hypothetical protein
MEGKKTKEAQEMIEKRECDHFSNQPLKSSFL